MSRAHNARQKARRQQARAAAEAVRHRRRPWSRRLSTVLPGLAIAATLAVAAILGLGTGSGQSPKQVRQEVAALLAGIPQRGTTLGSANAPLTLWIFGDVECPTVKSFVERYLPAIIGEWVRTGSVKLEYRSLQTDTQSEATFFRQEIAALAAGRQGRMWHFLLTFVREQGDAQTEYASNDFLSDIASQVPGLRRAQWNRDREDARLSKRVALGVHRAHTQGLRSTPSFLIGFTGGDDDRRASDGVHSTLRRKVELALRRDIESLSEEEWGDSPTLRKWELGT